MSGDDTLGASESVNDSGPLVVMWRERRLSEGDEVLVQPVAATTPRDRAGAFERMIDRSLDGQYRLATVILGDPLEAEDAVHDAALVAWRRFGDLRDPELFEAWFGRILVNGCRDRLRARRRRPIVRSLPVLGELDQGLATGDVSRDAADRDALSRAFEALEPEAAIVVVLRYYRDLTVPEIAARLRIPEGTVKSRLHHALRRLRVAINAGEKVAE